MADPVKKTAFVIGDPIVQSKSPLIHGHWLKTYDLQGDYKARHVLPEELSSFLEHLLADETAPGGNVTAPHKEEVHHWLVSQTSGTRLTPIARRLKAVNTLYRQDGELVGDNTDGFGFASNLDDRASGWDGELSNILIIGAGGASRAVIAALDERRGPASSMQIVNRTPARAQALVDDLQLSHATVHSFEQLIELAGSADFVVNTSSLGMGATENNITGNKSPLVAAAAAMGPGSVATDIVYSPLMTPFLVAAEQAGAETVDGLGMLLHQAVPGFEAWFGVRPKVTPQIRQLVLNAMGLA
ncbi:MAG: shikimate dehydrogenase [Pseudomonadota bacterium]